MLEGLRKQAPALPADGAAFDSALLLRAVRAAIAGGAVLALLLLALEAWVFTALPGYPAAVLVLLSMLVVPGLLLHEALLPRSRADIIERLAIAFPLGIAIAAPGGLLALWLNLSLDAFLRLHIVVATLVSAGAAFVSPPAARVWLSSTVRGWNGATLGLLLLAAIAIGGILASQHWAGDRLARNFDDWRYMTYVNSYMQRDHIDALHPVGVGEAAYPRMQINAWVVFQAAIGRTAGISAESVVMDDLTPILIVFALMATYALAKGLFRSRAVALLAVLIQLGYALIDMSHDEGLGTTMLFRMSEDKMVGTYILFPIGLLFVSRFFHKTQPSTLGVFALIGLALFVVHPQPLLFLGIALLALAFLQAATKRSMRPLIGLALFVVHPQPLLFLGIALLALAFLQATTRRSMRPLMWSAALGLPLAALTFGQFVVWHAFNTSWPALFDTTLTWREQFKIVHLPGDMIMGNYHLLLHPMMLGALALTPLLWWRSRRSLPHQLLFAAMWGWLPWFFLPPLTTLSAKLASAELIARLPYMAPVAIVWAYAVHQSIRWLRARWRAPAPLRAFAPAAAAALLLGIALIVQDLYYPIDKGRYFTWIDPQTIVPGTDRSIFVGGKDRLLSREWRISPDEQRLIDYLDTNAAEGAVVLAPDEVSLHLPGALWKVRPAYSQGILGQWERPPVMALYRGQLKGHELEAALSESQVQYVVTKYSSNAEAALTELPSAKLIIESGQYELYGIGQ